MAQSSGSCQGDPALTPEAAYGLSPAPGIFDSAAHNTVPADAWEYQIRRSLNDAAYQSLEYVPYCSTMPVAKKCDDPKFLWKKKDHR